MKGPYPLKLHFQPSLAMFVHEKTDIHISEQIIQNGIWESYETSILEALLFQQNFTSKMSRYRQKPKAEAMTSAKAPNNFEFASNIGIACARQ